MKGRLLHVMEDTVDGEYQNYKANDGAFVRKNFFGKDPKLLEMVSRMSDDDIWRLNRGGHDPHKIYAAYSAAVKHTGQPTVILAKTVKGYGMGKVGEGKNPTHQLKKLDDTAIREFRDRFAIPVPDDRLEQVPFFKPAADSAGDEVPARAPSRTRRIPAAAASQRRRKNRGARTRDRFRPCSSPLPRAARSRPRRRLCGR